MSGHLPEISAPAGCIPVLATGPAPAAGSFAAALWPGEFQVVSTGLLTITVCAPKTSRPDAVAACADFIRPLRDRRTWSPDAGGASTCTCAGKTGGFHHIRLESKP